MAEDSKTTGTDRKDHPRDYDSPRTPEGTPPVISPEEGDEMRQNETGTSEDARKDLEKRQRERTDREGAGEEELDSMRPETLFSPD